MGLEAYLQERLDQIAVEREEVLLRLEDVRAKMTRADAKRSGQEDTPNYKKWSSILRDLEHELDKHKAVLATLEAEKETKAHRLNEIRTQRESHERALKENYERINAMSAEEMANLTPEDLELLHEYELRLEAEARAEASPASEPTTPQYVQVTEFAPAEPEPDTPKYQVVHTVKPDKVDPDPQLQYAAQTVNAGEHTSDPAPPATSPAETGAAPPRAVQPPEPKPEERPPPSTAASAEEPGANAKSEAEQSLKQQRKRAFQTALEKSRRQSISELTFEEVAVLLTAYRKLVNQGVDSSDAASLEEDVSSAMWEVHAYCARICANWAQLMSREGKRKAG